MGSNKNGKSATEKANKKRVEKSSKTKSEKSTQRVELKEAKKSIKQKVPQERRGIYLKTLPSAHSYFLPLTSIGLSQAHMSLTNSRSSGLVWSSLVNLYDSQSGATSKAGAASWPRTRKAPLMTESFCTPKTDVAPKRYLREASRRVKRPPIWLADMKVMVSSSLYMKSTFQSEYSSKLQFSQNQGRATSRVSSLEYFPH